MTSTVKECAVLLQYEQLFSGDCILVSLSSTLPGVCSVEAVTSPRLPHSCCVRFVHLIVHNPGYVTDQLDVDRLQEPKSKGSSRD